MNGTDFVTAARSYLGVPFFHAGRSRQGLDCGGLLICAARDAGFTVANHANYPATYVDPDILTGYLSEYCDQIEWGPLADGDIGVFSIAGNPQHVAILTAEETMIHAYQSAGKVVEHPLDHHWRRRLVAVYRVREA